MPLSSFRRVTFVSVVSLVASLAGPTACHRVHVQLDPKNQTYAELRPVRRGVTVVPPGERAREPYARERLADGTDVTVDAGGVAWLRRDGGATLLIAGPAKLTLRSDTLIVDEGKLFVDTPAGSGAGAVTDIQTPGGPLHLSGVRASLTVGGARGKDVVAVYVLKGQVKTDAVVAASAGAKAATSALNVEAGEELVLADGKPTKHALLAWEDWTGGLATTDEAAEPAPFGVGTVGARPPGGKGRARSPLTIQKLDVKVTIDHDLAVTEVDELFFNPSSETVEGIYQFRTPTGATMHRFGVDRNGKLVWGRVKEQAAAAAQYQSNVYAGSTEDPALLEWNAPGVYQARLYPIAPGGTRRVVTRYAEWLPRQGARGERRLYVYPMAAEGAEASLPRIEEFRAVLDLGASGAKDIRAGMHGVQEGKRLIVRAYDLTPRADLAVELFDDGQLATTATAYRAKHKVDKELTALDDILPAEKAAKSEADYMLVPIRPAATGETTARGLDVAIVVDTSAATDPTALAIARSATTALLSHLGEGDRAAVWASDAVLRPVADGAGELRPVDDKRRDAIDAGLASVERGGATDLGAVLTEAAGKLDPARRGVVVYVGDGKPTVGELAVADLRERMSRLSHPVRTFALGVGLGANMGVLQGVAEGGFAERVVDDHGAAETALRLLEDAERPVWLGVKIDLGVGVDRIYPRETRTLFADETTLVVGRITSTEPTRVDVRGEGHGDSRLLTTVWMADDGDLRRRWAEGRLAQLLDEGAGRAAVVEVGTRYGVVTPFTSYYVPTTNELNEEYAKANPETRREMANADEKEGGTGTRAKGEEGSMGNPNASGNHRYGVQGPADNPVRSAAEFGMIGLLNGPPAAAPPRATEVAPSAAATPAPANQWGDAIGNSFGGGLGLSGAGEGGGGRGEGLGLAGIGTIGHGVATGNGQGFGNGHGALGGAHQTRAPSLRQGALQFLDAAEGNKLLAKAGVTLPPGPEEKKAPSQAKVISLVGSVGFDVRLCDASADQPLEERVLLWRERLVDVRQSPERVAAVYSDALARCEAPTWPERARLLYVMLDAVGSVKNQVALWRAMFEQTAAADVLYRGLLARVHTTAEMRELHDALGQKRIDPSLLRTTLDKEKTPRAKLAKLRELVSAWPDDLELMLHLLDAYEDAGDTAGERLFAKKLRHREDTNAKVRTAIGEAYLRLAKASGGSPADEAEARRTFGEIVEFAVDDPVARRRLGDLLRSHGWYEEAFRQYETLGKLTPDDVNVSLLLAAAAAGMGKVEEAVGWAEKAAGSAAPNGSGLGPVARDLAAVYLAWAEEDAKQGKRDKEAAALRERAARLSLPDRPGGKNARVFLTWSHPEVHPTLWSNARGTAEPATRGDALLGISAVTFSASRSDAYVELHFEPDDADVAARLGAEAVLTLIYDEGTDDERVIKSPVVLAPASATRRFRLGRDGVHEEALPASARAQEARR